jgi:hypothetical protein
MKTRLLLCVVSFALIACAEYPTPYPNGHGGVAKARIFGGKGMHTINADGSMAFTWDLEITAQHAFQAATALGLSYIDYLGEKVVQLTAQMANANLTKVQLAKIQSDLAAYTALLNAEKVKLGIGAGAPLGPVNFQ